jgi:hypothetical protein
MTRLMKTVSEALGDGAAVGAGLGVADGIDVCAPAVNGASAIAHTNSKIERRRIMRRRSR